MNPQHAPDVPVRPSGRGRLIMIEGIDGAGKSTLVESLVRELKTAGHPILLVSKKTREFAGDVDLSHRLASLNSAVYGQDWNGGSVWGDHHWLFLVASWYHLLDKCVIEPSLTCGTNVLVDNGFYKVLARYSARSTVPNGVADIVFADLIRPQMVLFLDIDPGIALARKEKFNPLEAGFDGDEADSFTRYQSSVRAAFQELAQGNEWCTIQVDDKDRDDVLESALHLVRPILSTGADGHSEFSGKKKI